MAVHYFIEKYNSRIQLVFNAGYILFFLIQNNENNSCLPNNIVFIGINGRIFDYKKMRDILGAMLNSWNF